MVKKTLFLLFAAAVTTSGFAQRYTLSGVAPKGIKNVYMSPLGEEAVDSTTADSKGKFTFKGDAKGKHLAYVFTKGENGSRVAVFLEGDIVVNLQEQTVVGNDENRGLNDFQMFTNATTKPLKELVAKLTAKHESGQELDENDLEAYYTLADSLSGIVDEHSKQVLKNAAGMRWPAFVVFTGANSPDADRDFLISLDTPDNVFMAEPCLERTKKLIAAYRRTQIGQKFADFEMADTAGVMHKLSEYVGRGNYVLIDFWATWCGPCMRELPNVKALYDKYHAKGFDIVGISFDQDAASWRAVIQRKQMNWTHLSDLGGWKSMPVEFYGVRAIPYTMLIAPDGTILDTNLTGEKLAEKLAEIFER